MVGNIPFTSGQFQYISIIGWSYLSHIFLIVWLYQYPCYPYSWEIQLLYILHMVNHQQWFGGEPVVVFYW